MCLHDREQTWQKPMMKRRRVLAWWGGFILPSLLLSLLARAADDPNQLVEQALAANPSLDALRARVAELEHLAEVAGTWKDPVIGIDYLNVPVDSFSLKERGIQNSERHPSVKPADIDALVDHIMANGTKVLWH